jgi:hypothetical protein
VLATEIAVAPASAAVPDPVHDPPSPLSAEERAPPIAPLVMPAVCPAMPGPVASADAQDCADVAPIPKLKTPDRTHSETAEEAVVASHDVSTAVVCPTDSHGLPVPDWL